MTAVTQTITPAAVVQLFSGIPRGSNNIYPRARVQFVDRTAITLKDALDTKVVNFILNLPENYAYRIDSININFGLNTSTEITQYEDLGAMSLSLNTGSNLLVRTLLKSEGAVTAGLVTGRGKVWSAIDRFTEVVQATSGNVRLILSLFDNDAVNETVAMDNLFYASFLQYDIQQIFDVSVNAPQPVSVV